MCHMGNTSSCRRAARRGGHRRTESCRWDRRRAKKVSSRDVADQPAILLEQEAHSLRSDSRVPHNPTMH